MADLGVSGHRGMTNAIFFGNGDTYKDRYGTGKVRLAYNKRFGDDVA